MLCIVLPKVASAQSGISIFEAFRVNMASAPASYVSSEFPRPLRKHWDNSAVKLLSNDSIKYFFSYAIIQVYSVNEKEAQIAFFNPWVDAIYLTKWRDEKASYRIVDGRFICGELLRGELISEQNFAPLWLRLSGKVLDNQSSYIARTMKSIANKDSKLAYAFTGASGNDEVISFVAMSAKIEARRVTAQKVLSDIKTRKAVERKLVDLKKALFGKDKQALSLMCKRANPNVIDTLASLPEIFSETLVANWYIESGDKLIIMISSYGLPRMFINLHIAKTGDISDIIVGDWGSLGTVK